MLLALSSWQGGPKIACRAPWPTHWQLLLQADAECLGVVRFQLLQGHSRLPDELVVAEFVLITHGDPGGQGHGQLFRHTGCSKVSGDLQAVGMEWVGRAGPCG